MEDKLNFRHQIADSVIIQLGSEKQISDIRRSDDGYFVVKIFSYMINMIHLSSTTTFQSRQQVNLMCDTPNGNFANIALIDGTIHMLCTFAH